MFTARLQWKLSHVASQKPLMIFKKFDFKWAYRPAFIFQTSSSRFSTVLIFSELPSLSSSWTTICKRSGAWWRQLAGESASKCAWPNALGEPATSIENLKESEMVSCIFYLFGFFSVENHCLYSAVLFNMKYFRLTYRFYDFKSFCLCRKLDVSWVFLQQRRVNLA